MAPVTTRQPNSGTFRPIGQVAAEIVARLRFRRQVERVHTLGPRVTAELLAEIGAERSIMTLIDQKIDRYAELEPGALEVTGGDQFWSAPLYVVRPSPEPPGCSGNRAITRDSTA